MRRTWPTILTATGITLAVVVPAAPAASAASGAAPQVRVNQVGYPSDGPKTAFVMLARSVSAVRFEVTTPYGVAYRGTSTDDVGSWNSAYRAVYQLNFSGLRVPGVYQVKVTAPAVALSPAFVVGTGAQLYRQLVDNAVQYFTSERDGPDVVPSVLGRQPANLTDETASVYADPSYDSNDNLLGTLKKIGGPVDVAGGWFDAGGGYEKFAYTASYADALMLIAARALSNGQGPGSYPALQPEAEFGLQWITELWNPVLKVLYAQVGIGNGNASNTIQGDYNFWFLPQDEDRMNVSRRGNPGPTAYFVKNRPVFEAAPPGKPVSPNLAGRFAADFALGAQLSAGTDVAQAQHLLGLARGVYAMAKTTNVGQLVTAFPHDYYPATQWKSDMAWGTAEIVLADEATGAPAAQLSADLATAARWTRAYIAQGHPADGDTFNLYDDGAVAEAELLQAMQAAPAGSEPAIAPATLLDDMAAQLRTGEDWAKTDPFALGTALGASDASPHAFGLFITNALYQKYGGSNAFESFAQQQLNFALGANAWGSSFVVGAGTVFPHCMQSEIANLAGSLTGRGDIQLGATTDGPSSIGNFTGLGTVPGMRACSAGQFAPFNNATAGYEDNVVSWPSVEPAGDYVAASLFAFALGGDQGSGLG
ncbi:MAG TPA: glycoside hydrolase family 9 protein [Streptosporangiaceae bacterium]|nr:glycoside hydrolase family 9 protein [Streptosporangiaceae bacterium]